MTFENNNVHVWAPEIFTVTGGLQTFSRYLIKALCDEIGTERVRVVLKNDSTQTLLDNDCFRYVNGCGHWPPILRKPRFAFECLWRAWDERPALIVSTHLNFGPIAQKVKELTGTPYVIVAHGVDAWNLKINSRIRAMHKADLVLAVSRYTRDQLIEKTGIDSREIGILPNTFGPARFQIGPKPSRLLHKYGISHHSQVILTVCRLAAEEQYKGYDQIIRSLPQILREVPDVRYLVVGTGTDRSRIEKLADDLGVKHAVTLAGFVPDNELCEYYNLCDLFAMPSKGEGFGIVYLEALSCGKPVLAGNKDGSRDALNDGELGVLVDPDDISEIAAQAIRILRRQHSNLNMFEPEWLRDRVTSLFGYETFQRTIADRLEPFLNPAKDKQGQRKVRSR